ncbi:hypothetical protein WJX81_002596 [Elliptochloris bilobata]|uniref:protein phosphatase methylesterase-1 n=1 Tax=Elliptochloris bilobata TaxID=381761 RepID=A0AAW1RWC7_9CHLO
MPSTIPDEEPVGGDGIEAPAVLVDEVDDGEGASSAGAAPWDRYFDELRDVRLEERGGTFRVYLAGKGPAVLFCLHGGGYCGLTWALVAAALKSEFRIAAMDMRGHGETTTEDNCDLSAATLVQDAAAVWAALYGEERAPTVLVGHSMGGAVAVRLAAEPQGVPALEGLAVIDVVEGTARAALPHMAAVLAARPPAFPSLRAALDWAKCSGTCRSTEAAAVSLPGMLRRAEAVDRARWVWRTPLERTQPFWDGWYAGLSALFLGMRAPKLLLLAGTDRLDRELTIGQMQGRFQLALLPQAGHAVHEDESQRTAELLQNFTRRFRVGEPKGPIPLPARAAGPPVLPQAVGPAAGLLAVARRSGSLAVKALFTRNKQADSKRNTGYDKSAVEVDPAQPAFTRRREVFVGRLAMFGFASALIGEIATGRGALGQLELETGLPPWGVDLLVLGIVAYSAIGALNPKSPTFSEANQRDVRKRPAGPNNKPNKIDAVSNPKGFFGITRFGFSKANEVFVGRTAQLGFLASLIGEKVTGFGPLKQFGLETGIPLGQASIGLVIFISFFLVAAVFEGNYGEDAISDDSMY